MKIRLQGTEAQLNEMLDFLRAQLGDRIQEISRPYKDRNAKTFRIYITLRD